MNDLDELPRQPEDSLDPPQFKPAATLASEAWDRRERDIRSAPALHLLGRAARYLIEDQMNADRTFNPGAWHAVELLWTAMAAVEEARITRQRVERLSSVWLPQQILSGMRGPGSAH